MLSEKGQSPMVTHNRIALIEHSGKDKTLEMENRRVVTGVKEGAGEK